MTVQWFPGHMAKARRQIQEKLQLVDIVFELLDARIPYSSSNPMMNEIIKHKPKLIILNKVDMADPNVTQQWLNYFKEQGQPAITIDALHQNAIKQITEASKEILKEKFAKEKAKGLRPRPVRAMILGIPNVGKSTLMNNLAKRKAAQTGDRPGVTKAQQWVKVGQELELLDTPGVLWPKFEEKRVGYNLAVTGAIKDTILTLDHIILYALDYLIQHYPQRLIERYHLSGNFEDKVAVLEEIGTKRGFLQSGGIVDYDKVYEILLREIRSLKLGRLSFECPKDLNQETVSE
ncbi:MULTISPECIES: ribosome biogenesis GTPase YlqF [Turicibacter]|jgi:ribosome biogenesis GTP-binding protein ylqF|uniref:Ribosome biogenesis GTPase A n=5 Tax=Turicibacter sanguinis TaxID=154288 RepID=A0A173R2Q7_9FIRM|nr:MULTISPECIES: ribosome biogenesis GTPase YlqF [Turicibacter]EFF64634.1 ribosome biogenesis GTP-binding protein YlqF [Turicibacter sanguinis PC909]EGC92601.1 ribosome biogenesis GTP-binding protein YlqF [Turicibacter sp. HGF1]MBP3905125.1 ribosome biogenesis GTPase YlqF [Turicibacter sp.]MCU7191282.1 ribosome biogenesis GTPase YlqF [Turicibacter sanguinis]MCU7196160.1 ribosome biogenesis GTPase YlqF [Turicibacter sanguinis]